MRRSGEVCSGSNICRISALRNLPECGGSAPHPVEGVGQSLPDPSAHPGKQSQPCGAGSDSDPGAVRGGVLRAGVVGVISAHEGVSSSSGNVA